MAFWSRLRQSRPYALYHCRAGGNQQPSSRCVTPISNIIRNCVQSSHFGVLHSVRFYAAPVQANQKKVEKDSGETKLNEEITFPKVMLVTDEGKIIVSRHEALSRARSQNLDLVLVDAISNPKKGIPPVCKIFDYNKEKYHQQLKEKERAKSKSTLKNGPPKVIRFKCKITPFDLQVKADMVRKLMESGHRVKCKSFEPTDKMDMKTVLSRFSALIEDVAVIESGPNVEKEQAYVVVRHAKFGPAKNSGRVKLKKSPEASQNEEDSDELSDQNTHSNNAEEDMDALFDTDDEDSRLAVSSKHASSNSSGVPKPQVENRYAKAPPRSAGPPRIPTNMSGPDPRNMINDVPRIPSPNTQPVFGTDGSSPTRPMRQVRGSSTHEVPWQDYGRAGNRHSIPDAHPATGTAPDRSKTEVTNRYQRNPPLDSQRSPSSPGFSSRQNFPGTDSRMSRGPSGESSEQRRWGTFDPDNSSRIPSKNQIGRR